MTWTAERYFSKAQSYWSRATTRERDSDEFLLNVAFFCEFVVRGAICSVNPTLNAASEEESILFAAGVAPNKPPKTVDIGTALTRVIRLIPNITEDESKTVSALLTSRNSELHGDEDVITSVPNKDVMPKIYSFIAKVADYSTQDLDALLGASDAAHARRTAEAIHKDRKKRVGDLIRIQKDRFFGLDEATQKEKREASKHQFTSAVMTSGHHVKTYKCPSCASLGLLGGTPVGRSAPILREDGIYEEVRVAPEVFACKCCELKIKGLDELMAAGIEHEFLTINEKDIIDHFHIDPMDYVDTDEIMREYHGFDEYMDE